LPTQTNFIGGKHLPKWVALRHLGAALFLLFILPAMAIGIPFAMVACAIGRKGSLAPFRSIRYLLVFLACGTSFQLQRLHALARALKKNFRSVHDGNNRERILAFLAKIADCDNPEAAITEKFWISMETILGNKKYMRVNTFRFFHLVFSFRLPPPQERLALDFLENLPGDTLVQVLNHFRDFSIFSALAHNASDSGCVRILNLLESCPKNFQVKILSIEDGNHPIPWRSFIASSRSRKKTLQKLLQLGKSWGYAENEPQMREVTAKILEEHEKRASKCRK
jgi:hypothetical protein